MHTFSCAVQSVDVEEIGTVRFDSDPNDYAICCVYIGDYVLTFDRNGMSTGVEKVEPEPDPEAAPEPTPHETESVAPLFPEPAPLSPKTPEPKP
jgi:hypothetical protein